MNYSMAFKVDIYDFDNEKGDTIITRPGDYIRTKAWEEQNTMGEGDELVQNIRVNYATAWFALKRLGRLEEFGLPEKLTVEAIDEMADRLSVFVGEIVGVDSLPLRKQG